MALRSFAPGADCLHQNLMLPSVVTLSGKASWRVLRGTTTSGFVSHFECGSCLPSKKRGTQCQFLSWFSCCKMQGDLEGSARYRELMTSAEHFFQRSVASESRWGLWLCTCRSVWSLSLVSLVILFVCVLSALSPGEEILQLVQSFLPLNLEELRKQEAQLPLEDSEWMNFSRIWQRRILYCHTTKLYKGIWRPDGGLTFSCTATKPVCYCWWGKTMQTQRVHTNSTLKRTSVNTDQTHGLLAVSHNPVQLWFNHIFPHFIFGKLHLSTLSSPLLCLLLFYSLFIQTIKAELPG